MTAPPSKRLAAAVSIASNATLVLGKLVIGVITGSVAVISEAIHSGMDLVASIIAFVAVSYSDRPADGSHPHGHGKIENLSGAIEALLIFGAIFFICYEAIGKLVHGAKVAHIYLGSIIMGVSALVNTIVSWYLHRVGKRTDSEALLADAAHLRTDVYTSLGIFAGLLLVHFTRRQWLDPVAALTVALLIGWEAWQITRRSVGVLLDESLPEEEQAMLRQVISEAGASFHALRTRKSGATRIFNLHLDVSPTATAADVHRLCDRIIAEMRRRLPGVRVLIHPEPTQQCAGTELQQWVEGVLDRHRSLFVRQGELQTGERDGRPLVLLRLQFDPAENVAGVQIVCAHLSKHILEHSPEAQVFIQPGVVDR